MHKFLCGVTMHVIPSRTFASVIALVAVLTGIAPTRSALAVYWNNDPAFGVTSTIGLTDRTQWFQNTHVIYNQTNNSRGTATLLNSEWAITVRHVVQNGGNYSQIATPGQIRLDVLGTQYFGDQIFTPDGGSEIALVHLAGNVAGALDATSRLNNSFDEGSRIIHFGGYGLWGHLNTLGAGGTVAGTSSGNISFHRAYNIPWVPGQIQIIADGEQSLENMGLLEGIAGSGDSGGPMWGFYGTDFSTQASDMNQWRLVGLTATASSPAGTWGGNSNHTRVANYYNWINNTIASYGVGPTTTGPWTMHSGSGLYDTGGDRFSVTNSNAAPVVHASFGEHGDGYTLDSVGDKLSMSAVLNTPSSMGDVQFRFGMFDDAEGTIPGNVAGGTPWSGYFVGNSTEGAPRGVYEKGANGGGVGQWWSIANPNTAPILDGSPTQAVGSFGSAAGTQAAPAGKYQLKLDYTRVEEGLKIEWSMISLTVEGTPVRIYSHLGSVIDTSPASSAWTYNKLGFFLLGGAFSGAITMDNIAVAFTDVVSLTGDYNLDGKVDAADYTLWRDTLGQSGMGLAADGNRDAVIDALDYEVWKSNFGVTASGGGNSALAVPEPGTALLFLVLLVGVTARHQRHA
jgi:hypothetical protein